MHSHVPVFNLLFFKDSYGWQIRHGAVLGLSRVNKTCRSLPMKDGLSDVAWAKLAERQALERNASVLQAFSLTQVRVQPPNSGAVT